MSDRTEYKSAHYFKNREKYAEASRLRYIEKRQEILERRKQRRAARTDEQREADRLYRKSYVVATRDVQAARKQTDKYKYGEYRVSARKRGFDFSLTLEQFLKVFHAPCSYCGTEDSRGIDRVDSSIGYIKENCAGACKFCNIMKSTHSKQDFIQHAKRIAAFNP